MPDAQARRLWQEHRRVRQPPLLSSSLTGRLLGKHCWSLTAVCSLAPLSVLLSLHYLQVLRVCTAHLSIRGDEAISRADGARVAPRGSDWRWHTNGWMTLKMSEALLGAATQQGWVSFFQRRIRRQWIDARGQRAMTNKADCLCFITQQDKSSVKHKTAGCFLQGRRFFRSGCHMDDGPQASPCPSTS